MHSKITSETKYGILTLLWAHSFAAEVKAANIRCKRCAGSNRARVRPSLASESEKLNYYICRENNAIVADTRPTTQKSLSQILALLNTYSHL
jgi:hypothetical protein